MSNMHPNIQQLMCFLFNFNHKQHDVVFYGPNWKQLLGIHCAKAFEIPVKSSKICKPYSFGLLLNVFWIMKIMQDGKFFFNQHHNLINDWSKIRKEMFFKKKVPRVVSRGLFADTQSQHDWASFITHLFTFCD